MKAVAKALIFAVVFFGCACIVVKLEDEYFRERAQPRPVLVKKYEDDNEYRKLVKIHTPYWGLILARREGNKVVLECRTPGFTYTVEWDTPEAANTYAIGGGR